MVTVAEASLGTVQQVIDGSGTVQSEEVKTYFSPVAATVDSFSLKVGDTVEAGETLLTYDAAELDELYRQAELTGSAANYSYQDSISKDNENVAEYNRSTAALDIINRQLDEEDDNLDHLNDRVREYTGYQGDSANKLASLKEQQAQAQAAVADLEEKNAALKSAQMALESSTLDPASEEYKMLQDAVTVAQAAVDEAAPALRRPRRSFRSWKRVFRQSRIIIITLSSNSTSIRDGWRIPRKTSRSWRAARRRKREFRIPQTQPFCPRQPGANLPLTKTSAT